MEKETIQAIAQVAVPVLSALVGILITYVVTMRKQKRIDRENLEQFQKHILVIVTSIMGCNGFGQKFKELYITNLKINNLQPQIKTIEE